MNTSTIQHPKNSFFGNVHSWQFKLFKGNFNACLLMSFLEDRFNEMIKSPKNKGWMLFSEKELIEVSFSKGFAEMNTALLLIELYDFIDLDVPPDIEKRKDFVWIYFNALNVNNYLNSQNNSQLEVKIDPFVKLMFCLLPYKDTQDDARFIYKNEVMDLFDFWKKITGHHRSSLDEKTFKLIKARMKDGYTVHQIAKAIYGLKLSPHHMGVSTGVKYDGLKYVVKDSEAIDRFSSLVDVHNPGLDIESLYLETLTSQEKPQSTISIYSNLK